MANIAGRLYELRNLGSSGPHLNANSNDALDVTSGGTAPNPRVRTDALRFRRLLLLAVAEPDAAELFQQAEDAQLEAHELAE